MSKCPINTDQWRPGLPEPIDRIAALPVDDRGYPIPFFVAVLDGKPDFRLADPLKIIRCVKEKLCWVCGTPLGHFKAFSIGPMCSITRTSSEPPGHVNCMEWSVKGCPFLTKPKMVRREDEVTDANKGNVAGIMSERNPGVTCVWVTERYSVFPDPTGKPLFNVGNPVRASWWREGRPATRAEVLESMDSGLPALQALAEKDGPKAEKELAVLHKIALEFLPAEMTHDQS